MGSRCVAVGHGRCLDRDFQKRIDHGCPSTVLFQFSVIKMLTSSIGLWSCASLIVPSRVNEQVWAATGSDHPKLNNMKRSLFNDYVKYNFDVCFTACVGDIATAHTCSRFIRLVTQSDRIALVTSIPSSQFKR